ILYPAVFGIDEQHLFGFPGGMANGMHSLPGTCPFGGFGGVEAGMIVYFFEQFKTDYAGDFKYTERNSAVVPRLFDGSYDFEFAGVEFFFVFLAFNGIVEYGADFIFVELLNGRFAAGNG